MKLSEITKKTKLVADFSKRLSYSAKEKIVATEVEKVKRISGASVRPVSMALENGQTVKIYLRLVDDGAKYDIFRIDVNGKMIPLAGDFDNGYDDSFNASVDALATMIKTGQKKFDAKRAKMKVRKTPTGGSRELMNKSQQRNALLDEVKDLDVIIQNKTTEKAELTEQLAKIKESNK
ncbi:hypothetical protein Q6344_06790 [Psychrobacter cibarius]|nr:hypothetical protein Q6344_06790 [Psychrobacter cibarius]